MMPIAIQNLGWKEIIHDHNNTSYLDLLQGDVLIFSDCCKIAILKIVPTTSKLLSWLGKKSQFESEPLKTKTIFGLDGIRTCVLVISSESLLGSSQVRFQSFLRTTDRSTICMCMM